MATSKVTTTSKHPRELLGGSCIVSCPTLSSLGVRAHPIESQADTLPGVHLAKGTEEVPHAAHMHRRNGSCLPP